MQQDTAIHEEFALTAEPRLVYSNRSYWYPQAPVTDYATGVLRLTVPDTPRLRRVGDAGDRQPGARHDRARVQPALRLPRQPAGALLLDRGLAARPGQRHAK